jgi:hypothetical protein
MADVQAVLAEETDRARSERHGDATGSPRDYIAGLLRRAQQDRPTHTAAPYASQRLLERQSAPLPPAPPPPGAAAPAPVPALKEISPPLAGSLPAASPSDPASPSGQGWRRWELAPGVELQVRDDVAAAQAGLISRLRDVAKEHDGSTAVSGDAPPASAAIPPNPEAL